MSKSATITGLSNYRMSLTDSENQHHTPTEHLQVSHHFHPRTPRGKRKESGNEAVRARQSKPGKNLRDESLLCSRLTRPRPHVSVFVWKRILFDAFSPLVYTTTIENADRFHRKRMSGDIWNRSPFVVNGENGGSSRELRSSPFASISRMRRWLL